MEIKFRDPDDQKWWSYLSKTEKRAVKKAYQCYDMMAETPLVDDLPDKVVEVIRKDASLNYMLNNAKNAYEKEQVLDGALYAIGEHWLRINSVEITSGRGLCGLRRWLEFRKLDDLVVRCARAVDLEFERVQKEA